MYRTIIFKVYVLKYPDGSRTQEPMKSIDFPNDFIKLKRNIQISFVKVESYTEHTTTYIRKKDTHN